MYRFLIPLFALALLIGCTPQAPADTEGSASASSAPAMNAASSVALLTGTHRVALQTSLGTMTVEVYADQAPLAATNFVMHAQNGYYDGLTFHRVIPGFMIQGGDPSGNGTGGESVFGDDFDDEQTGIALVRGVLAMANRGPHTNGSQFFIVQAEETPWLDGRHTAFGKVVEGLDVLDAIANTPVLSTDPRSPEANRPKTPVTFDAEVLK